jgi:HEAT repeat protein
LAGFWTDLIAGLDATDGMAREHAAEELLRIGAASKVVLWKIIEVLERPQLSATIRANLILTIGKIGSDGGAAVPVLIRRLSDHETAWFAAFALSSMKAHGRAASDALLRIAESPDHPARTVAAFALAEVDPESGNGIGLLVRMAREGDVITREFACRYLGEASVNGDSGLLAALREGLDDGDSKVRVCAAISLVRKGGGRERERAYQVLSSIARQEEGGSGSPVDAFRKLEASSLARSALEELRESRPGRR